MSDLSDSFSTSVRLRERRTCCDALLPAGEGPVRFESMPCDVYAQPGVRSASAHAMGLRVAHLPVIVRSGSVERGVSSYRWPGQPCLSADGIIEQPTHTCSHRATDPDGRCDMSRRSDFQFDEKTDSLCCPSPNYCCPHSLTSCADPRAILFDLPSSNVSDETIMSKWPITQARPFRWLMTPRSYPQLAQIFRKVRGYGRGCGMCMV